MYPSNPPIFGSNSTSAMRTDVIQITGVEEVADYTERKTAQGFVLRMDLKNKQKARKTKDIGPNKAWTPKNLGNSFIKH